MVQDSNGNTETYQTTEEHPFWVDASNLKAGYKLLSENGQWQIVQNIKVTDEPLSAYNLTVNNDHTYFVTGSGTTYGVWVHNSCFVKPSRNLKVGDRIDISNFKESRFNGQKVYRCGNYMIVKDRRAGTSSAHGGSFWKILDKQGNRIGTLSEDGRYLRR